MNSFIYSMRQASLALLLVYSALAGHTRAQTVRFVSTNGTNTNPATATSWANSTTSLQGAIDASQPGDMVFVAKGTYKPTVFTGPESRNVSFTMKEGVAIYGGFAGTEAQVADRQLGEESGSVLSGSLDGGYYPYNVNSWVNSYHVVRADVSSASVLDGFVITGGAANTSGYPSVLSGGGLLSYGSPRIVNCHFNGNVGYWGAGAYTTGSATFTNCVFSNNVAGIGGGGLWSSHATVINCRFYNNGAGGYIERYQPSSLPDYLFGGGVFSEGSTTLLNCVFQHNSSEGLGGGICLFGGTVSMVNCSFEGNSARKGGGISVDNPNSNLSLTNCSFQGNQAIMGGAIFTAPDGSITNRLTNCVLFDNGGIRSIAWEFLFSWTLVTADHCLFDDSVASYAGSNNRTTSDNPFASSSTLKLSAQSPAINAGSNAAYAAVNGPATDLDGNPRIFPGGGTIDMGAYESQVPVLLTIEGPTTDLCAGQSATLTAQGADTYRWSTGETSPSISVSATGTYSVTGTSSTFTATASRFIRFADPPEPPSLITQYNQSYPGGVSSLTMSQNVGSVLLWANYSDPFSNQGTLEIEGVKTTTLAVGTDQTGVYTYTATNTVNGCTSLPARFQLTVVPTTLAVLYRDADYGNPTNQIIKPFLKLVNTGDQPIPYSELIVRYWFTSEGNAPPTIRPIYYAPLGVVQTHYEDDYIPRQGALDFIEYSFPGGGTLEAGSDSGPIENGIQKPDGSNFNEADDYSYAPNYVEYRPNVRIAAYRKNPNGLPVIVWGQEPTPIPAQAAVQVYSAAKDSPTTSQIQTRVELKNTGTMIFLASQLTMRYYFTSDNGQPATVYVDYADIGAANVQARVVRMSSAVNGADSYVELSFPNTFIVLKPLYSLGVIDFRIVRSDYGLLDQTNDYSYAANYGNLSLNNHITTYQDNAYLLFGSEPSSGGRVAAGEPVASLSVRVLGNPVVGNQATVEIRAAEGQAVGVHLVDLQGRSLHEQQIEQAGKVEQVQLPLGANRGVFLLNVNTDTQQQHSTILRP